LFSFSFRQLRFLLLPFFHSFVGGLIFHRLGFSLNCLPTGRDTGYPSVFHYSERKETPMIAKTQPKSPLGQVVATSGVLEALHKAGQSAIEFLQRHARGDWGDVCEEDRQANDQSLLDGSRILSACRTSHGEKIWIITEAADDSGSRSATTILLPSEY
jgi:hypothetical protein